MTATLEPTSTARSENTGDTAIVSPISQIDDNQPEGGLDDIGEFSRVQNLGMNLLRAREAIFAFAKDEKIDPITAPVNEVLNKYFFKEQDHGSGLFRYLGLQSHADIERQQEQQKLVELMLLAYYVYVKAHDFLAKNKRGITITAPGTKGGIGKTFITSNAAVAVSWAAQLPVFCAEINENDGTIRYKMGANRDGRPLLPEVARNPQLIEGFAKMAATLSVHPQVPVYSLLSDSRNEEYRNLRLRDILAAIETGMANVGATVCDMGNGLGANEAAVLSADVITPGIYVRDSTSFSTFITTLINLHQHGHAERIKKHARFVLTGVNPGESLIDYEAQLIQQATAEASLNQHVSAWKNNPYQMLDDFGLLEPQTDESWPRLNADRWNTIRYSEYGSLPVKASILPEDTGVDTLIDNLRLLNDAFDTEMPTDSFKLSERQRRLNEVAEAEKLRKLLIDVPLSEEAINALTSSKRRELIRQLADKEVQEKVKQ